MNKVSLKLFLIGFLVAPFGIIAMDSLDLGLMDSKEEGLNEYKECFIEQFCSKRNAVSEDDAMTYMFTKSVGRSVMNQSAIKLHGKKIVIDHPFETDMLKIFDLSTFKMWYQYSKEKAINREESFNQYSDRLGTDLLDDLLLQNHEPSYKASFKAQVKAGAKLNALLQSRLSKNSTIRIDHVDFKLNDFLRGDDLKALKNFEDKNFEDKKYFACSGGRLPLNEAGRVNWKLDQIQKNRANLDSLLSSDQSTALEIAKASAQPLYPSWELYGRAQMVKGCQIFKKVEKSILKIFELK